MHRPLIGQADRAGHAIEEFANPFMARYGKDHVAVHEDDRLDTCRTGQQTDFGLVQQRVHFLWDRTVDVDSIGAETVHILPGLATAQLAVDLHPLAVAGHIHLGDECIQPQFDMRLAPRRRDLAAKCAYGLLQQAAVQLVTDGGDVPALLSAKDVARAADFQVAHGDLETGP